jgi:hypothetical protein
MIWDVKIYLAKIKDSKGKEISFPAKKSLPTKIWPLIFFTRVSPGRNNFLKIPGLIYLLTKTEHMFVPIEAILPVVTPTFNKSTGKKRSKTRFSPLQD